ncbi:S24 family peptidase [Pseudomonas prosekii]|uniref:Phage repressor protein C, contains Cro/C1-type HTH and peptisase s24 domains n=1 Tax=Pseudomonas prosekii TaxID=1148509 RepID=A0A1H2B213_9PSED|nr:S24 family peptidase [Pseudomonas prosekii]SDT52213.1 Phage repressor protein C, contains Cro/C1-type HTH and peptisase s24 domains [Pseudomonas prosekii]
MVQIEEIRNSFVARLKQSLSEAGIPEWGAGVRLAKMAKVTPKACSKWLNGESMPGGAKMLALATALNVRVEWLEYGRGDMRESAGAAPDQGRTPPRSFDLEDEPGYTGVMQLTARGSTGDGEDNPHVEIRGVMAFKSAWLRANNLSQRHLDVIYADGHSMEPTINDGDVLLIDEAKIEPKDGHVFAMQSASKGTIVKRLVKSDFDGWIIRSDNPDKTRYGDETLRDGEINEVRIIGRVVWRGGML